MLLSCSWVCWSWSFWCFVWVFLRRRRGGRRRAFVELLFPFSFCSVVVSVTRWYGDDLLLLLCCEGIAVGTNAGASARRKLEWDIVPSAFLSEETTPIVWYLPIWWCWGSSLSPPFLQTRTGVQPQRTYFKAFWVRRHRESMLCSFFLSWGWILRSLKDRKVGRRWLD